MTTDKAELIFLILQQLGDQMFIGFNVNDYDNGSDAANYLEGCCK